MIAKQEFHDTPNRVVVHLHVAAHTRKLLRLIAANGGMHSGTGDLVSVSEIVSEWAKVEAEALGLTDRSTDQGIPADLPRLPDGVNPNQRVPWSCGDLSHPRSLRLDQLGPRIRHAFESGADLKNTHLSVCLTDVRVSHRPAVLAWLQAQMPEGLHVDDDEGHMTNTSTTVLLLDADDLVVGLNQIHVGTDELDVLREIADKCEQAAGVARGRIATVEGNARNPVHEWFDEVVDGAAATPDAVI